MGIILTEKAAKEIKNIIIEQRLDDSNSYLRIGVKGGGCSGFTYMLDLVENVKNEFDEEYEQHGVKILVDQKSMLYLDGTVVDFKDELMGRGFTFANPNSTSSCGCGSSFSA